MRSAQQWLEAREPLCFETERPLIRLRGDLDTYNAPATFAHILEQAEANNDCVEVDLAGVAFIDSTALVRLRRTLPNMRVVGRLLASSSCSDSAASLS